MLDLAAIRHGPEAVALAGALTAARRGSLVAVVPGGEGLALLTLPAAAAKQATVNRLASLGASHISACLCKRDYADLGLPPIDARALTTRPFAGWASVEAADGVTTGISAGDRAATLRVIASGARRRLVQPGHVFVAPVDDAGLHGTAGAREAAVELASWAGWGGAAAIAPLLGGEGAPLPGGAAAAMCQAIGAPVVDVASVLAGVTARRLADTAAMLPPVTTPDGALAAALAVDGRDRIHRVYAAGDGPCRVIRGPAMGGRTDGALDRALRAAARDGGSVLVLATSEAEDDPYDAVVRACLRRTVVPGAALPAHRAA